MNSEKPKGDNGFGIPGPARARKCHVLSTAPGCVTNLLETAAWRREFGERGYIPCGDPASADLLIVNTCAYSHAAEDAAIKTIENLKKKYGGEKEILVAGCLTGINPARLREAYDGDRLDPPESALNFFASQHRFDARDLGRLTPKHKAVLFLRSWYFAAERFVGRRFQPLHNIIRTVMANERYYVITVSTGCMGACTFCAIRNFKGRHVSRTLEAIMADFRKGIEEGARDFWLLGDDLGCWGQDVGLNLAVLLRELLSSPLNFSLVINYADPSHLLKYAEELLPCFGDPRVVLVNIPIQSGSPEVLERMGRQPETGRLTKWIAEVKRRNPALVVKTNLMVGFPGETWRDLFLTWSVLPAFDAAVGLKYSARPGTPAAAFPDQHGEVSKNIRFWLTQFQITKRHFRVLVESLLS